MFRTLHKILLSPEFMVVAAATGAVASYYIFTAPPDEEPVNPYQIVDTDMSDNEITAARKRGEVTRLTDGEEAMAYKIFGDTINLDDVYVRFSDQNCSRFLWIPIRVAWVDGRGTPGIRDTTVTFCRGARTENYSAYPEGRKGKIFMHEISHVWQNQHDVGRWCETYDYKLNNNTHLRDYCVEQQATIISDYSIRFVFGDKAGKPIKSNDDYNLARIVEDVLPQARITRYNAEINYGRAPS